MSDLPTRCDLGYPESKPCNEPVTFYAISAYAPDPPGWNDSAAASLGGYCSLEHAEAEPRPSLAQAERIYRSVVERAGLHDPVTVLWQQLIDAYPNPVPAQQDGE